MIDAKWLKNIYLENANLFCTQSGSQTPNTFISFTFSFFLMSETANPVIKIIYEKVALELKLISVFFN